VNTFSATGLNGISAATNDHDQEGLMALSRH
jgi:hypothetical protein